VLQQEIYYSPNHDSDGIARRALRHTKRYRVPESPLLQVRSLAWFGFGFGSGLGLVLLLLQTHHSPKPQPQPQPQSHLHPTPTPIPNPTPTPQLHWWRVVFDEAQNVGGSGGHSATAEMGQRIAAQHRWCVTGTPIGPGGFDDVLGLLRALHAAPFVARPNVFRVSAWVWFGSDVGWVRFELQPRPHSFLPPAPAPTHTSPPSTKPNTPNIPNTRMRYQPPTYPAAPTVAAPWQRCCAP